MIAMITGRLMEKSEGEAVIMTAGGLALQVFCSMNTLSSLPQLNTDCTLLTHLCVKEDAVELYGFSSKEERSLFRLLISVSGIGPKTALQVLGSMSVSDLRMAILTGDTGALSRAPGIGKKTAQRISLELKDKLTKDVLVQGEELASYIPAEIAGSADAFSEAMLGLKSLGYSPQEAANALKGVKGKAETADEMIRLALRQMAQNT